MAQHACVSKQRTEQAADRRTWAKLATGESPPDSEQLCPATFGDRNHNYSKSVGPRACQKRKALTFLRFAVCAFDGEMPSLGGMIKAPCSPDDAPNPPSMHHLPGHESRSHPTDMVPGSSTPGRPR